jgi:hypothetical protein
MVATMSAGAASGVIDASLSQRHDRRGDEPSSSGHSPEELD